MEGSVDLEELLVLSQEQGMLPLVLDTLCRQGLEKQLPAERQTYWQDMALKLSIRSIIQTNELLGLLIRAEREGLVCIVIKGILLRDLYLYPMLRPSVDEDLLIRPEDAGKWHSFLTREGFRADTEIKEEDMPFETSYHKKHSPSYLELHTGLFDPASPVFGKMNGLFGNVWEDAVRIRMEDCEFMMPDPTDHLLYLILHAFKHFLYSGTGIRPLCDIGMFAERYEEAIDWHRIRQSLEKAHAFVFACALFRVLALYLLPDAGFYRRLKDWELEKTDPEPILEDMLEGGLHGASSTTRLHSAGITLRAVENDRQGRKRSQSLLPVLFPPVKSLASRYPYLKKVPALLPLAWVQRIGRYAAEVSSEQDPLGSGESLSLGRKRIRLLRYYKVIGDDYRNNA